MISESTNTSKSAGSDSAKTARNSWRRFLAVVLLRLLRIFNADNDEDEEGCEEVDDGILKLYPLRWAPK
jgi:hypothetical protein